MPYIASIACTRSHLATIKQRITTEIILRCTPCYCLGVIRTPSNSWVYILLNGIRNTTRYKSKKYAKIRKLSNQNQNPALITKTGKKLKLQIVKTQREHMVYRVSSYFSKGGHSATKPELKDKMDTRKVKHHRNTDTKNRQTENHNKTIALEV